MDLSLILSMHKKSGRRMNSEIRGFIHHLGETNNLHADIKDMLFNALNVKRGLGSIFHIFSKNQYPSSRKETIQKLSRMLNEFDDNSTLKPLQKLRLKDNHERSYFLDLARKDFNGTLPSDEERTVIAYRLYNKYREYLETMNANKTDLLHTLKYNTGVQHLKHRMPKINKLLGTTGDYFYDSNEEYVKLERNKTEGDKKLNVNKYFFPIWTNVRRVTEKTVQDTEKLNIHNKGVPPISLKAGDYIVNIDISPHEYQGGKPLKEAQRKLQEYLKGPVYDDIIADAKRNGKELKKEDIHIPFLFGITALTTFAKAGKWETRKIPLQDAKRTSTYMYGLLNPHAIWSEQPLMLRFKGIFSKKARMQYKQLKRMSQKFDARDIEFHSIPTTKFLSTTIE